MRAASHHIRKLVIASISLLVLSLPGFGQQRAQFSQYMFNGLVLNPAYAGAEEALSLTFIQRSQWTGVKNAPSTQTVSGHTLFLNRNMGVGMSIINDRIGVHQNLNVLGNYAYHIKVLDHSVLSMGLRAGIHYRRSDYSGLAGSANDPNLVNPLISRVFFDLGAGVYYRSPRFHAGLSVPGLVPENVRVNDTLSISLSKATVFAFSKYRIPVSETIDAEPSVLLKYMAGVPFSYDINMNMIFRKVLTLGLSYRKEESVDFLLKAQVTPQLQFGYSYDYPIGEIAGLTNGSHEIVVHYLFKYVQKNVSSPR